MAVRPPQDDIDDGPDTIAFGIAVLDTHLDNSDIEFPTDKETLRASLGDTEISYNAAGNTMTLDTALDSVSKDHFENEREVLNTLHPVFEERRKTGSTSILARIRSFIPL
jgi:hypothetical protein